MLRHSALIVLFGLGVCYAAVIPTSVNDILVTRESNGVPQGVVGVRESDDLETAATSYHGRDYYGGYYGYPGHHHHYNDYHHHHGHYNPYDDYHHHHHHEPYHHHDYYGHHHHHHGDSIGFGIPGLFDVHFGK